MCDRKERRSIDLTSGSGEGRSLFQQTDEVKEMTTLKRVAIVALVRMARPTVLKRLLVVAVVLAVPLSAAFAQLTFTSIDYPGGTVTTTHGINKQGEIVGVYRVP